MQNYINKNQLKNYLGVSLSTIDRKLKELPTSSLAMLERAVFYFLLERLKNILKTILTK